MAAIARTSAGSTTSPPAGYPVPVKNEVNANPGTTPAAQASGGGAQGNNAKSVIYIAQMPDRDSAYYQPVYISATTAYPSSKAVYTEIHEVVILAEEPEPEPSRKSRFWTYCIFTSILFFVIIGVTVTAVLLTADADDDTDRNRW